MAARFVAAVDHGTTSTRCILFDANGTPAAASNGSADAPSGASASSSRLAASSS